jgi:hypothetical protein
VLRELYKRLADYGRALEQLVEAVLEAARCEEIEICALCMACEQEECTCTVPEDTVCQLEVCGLRVSYADPAPREDIEQLLDQIARIEAEIQEWYDDYLRRLKELRDLLAEATRAGHGSCVRELNDQINALPVGGLGIGSSEYGDLARANLGLIRAGREEDECLSRTIRALEITHDVIIIVEVFTAVLGVGVLVYSVGAAAGAAAAAGGCSSRAARWVAVKAGTRVVAGQAAIAGGLMVAEGVVLPPILRAAGIDPYYVGIALSVISIGAFRKIGRLRATPVSTARPASVTITPACVAPHATFRPGPFATGSIPARSAARDFTEAERAAINQIGRMTGCHTCGALTPGTRSGNFVPDHQPVTGLNTARAPQRLYPHCIDCSRAQGLAVARHLREQ